MIEDKDEIRLVRAVTQVERNKMIQYLLKGSKNISDLAKLVDLDRTTVSYHLGVLEYTKIVKSDYKMLQEPHSMGKIGRYYTINPVRLRKAKKALQKLNL